jgi:hypothetical protein
MVGNDVTLLMEIKSMKYEHKILLAQVIISVLTLIITPLATWLVVSHQLSQQHQYWYLERDHLKKEHQYQTKMKIIEETAGLLNRLNNAVLTFQVCSENKSVARVLGSLLKNSNETESSDYFNEFKNYREKTNEAFFNILELESSLHQQQAISLLFFKEGINPFFVNYFEKIKKLKMPLMSYERIRENILESWSKNKISKLAIDSVSKISSELYKQSKAVKDSALILDWMYKDLSTEIGGHTP